MLSEGDARDTRRTDDSPQRQAAFRRTRKQVMWLGGVPVFGGVIIWLAAAGPYNQGMLGIPRSVWLGVGLALAAWGLLFSYAMYRCPHCRRPITSAGVQSGVAFDFNAKRCPRCGCLL